MSFSFSSADRPAPPRDIVISDIKSESCYLTWSAPDDNGGSDIVNYIIERRDASKKKTEWEQLTSCVVDRRFGVSFGQFFFHSGKYMPSHMVL